jgi:hypothetical protein
LLDKPAGTWCRHADAGGCAVHGPRKPDVCRQYDCFWREHETLSVSWRPDRVGVVVTEAGSVSVGHHLLPVVVFQEDSRIPENFAEKPLRDRTDGGDASPVPGDLEATSAANRGVAAGELLDHFLRRGFAVMIVRGLQARIEFDRGRWPGVSAEDIEAALRYELSQDAEELKQLGAVGDDYRPLSRDEAKAACRDERARS